MAGSTLNESLESDDREIYDLIQEEKYRQITSLELIASENFTARSVLEANGSPLTNKYSEGLPGARYYGGNEIIDKIEILCRKRALDLFNLDSTKWGVNVQPYSGSTANFSILTAVLEPQDRLMGLSLPSGGHLTHGHYTQKRKISSSSIYFTSLQYGLDKSTGCIDYEKLSEMAKEFKPRLLICGASAYPRDFDYAKFREIADSVGAYLMMDMAHISGLVVGKVQNNPFDYCDIVMTTAHKTLRGPRAALIFFRRAPPGEKLSELENKINFAVFPSNQGGPHNNTIAAVAVSLKQAASPEFAQYASQIIKNSKRLAQELISRDQEIASGGTDNHLILWNVKKFGLTGSKMEKICEFVNITLNKNSLANDSSASTPGGVRVGTPALTSRGFIEKDFTKVAEFLLEALNLGLEIQKTSGPMLKDFEIAVKKSDKAKELKRRVVDFCKSFPMPGFDLNSIPSYIVESCDA